MTMVTTNKSRMIAGSLVLVGVLSGVTATPSAAQGQGNPGGAGSLASVSGAPQMVQLSKTFTLNGGSANATLLFAVPNGKRLVIETVTVRAELSNGEFPSFAELTTNESDPNPGLTAGAVTRVYHEILVAPQGLTVDGKTVFVGTHPIRAYGEPNTFVFFQFGRNNKGADSLVQVSISGYLVDA
jgi:hypothetical protein